MYTKFMDIDEEIAAKMLEKNTDNYRKINMTTVHRYARKMECGYWQENAEPIHFSKSGKLLNGQHRLRAIIESHTTQRMLVVFDVDADVYDTGRNRTLREYSNINSAIGGSITAILSRFSKTTKLIIGNEEKTEYYTRYNGYLDKAYLFSCRGASTPMLKKAGCIAAVYCALRFDLMPEKYIEAFCRIVNSGLPEEEYASESPLVLRKTIMNFKRGGGSFVRDCFDVTWQAMIAFKRGLKSRNLYKPNGKAMSVIDTLFDMDKEATA